MKNCLLLSILILLIAGRALAQAPVFLHERYDGFGCLSGQAFVAIDFSGAVTSTIWEESTDGGLSWHAVPNTPQYSSSIGQAHLDATAILDIGNVSLAMNRYLYRVTLSNADGPATSPVMILFVAQDPPPHIEIITPTTDVCQGGFLEYTITGGLQEDSIHWYGLVGGGTADTLGRLFFPNVGQVNFSAQATNGCGWISFFPVTVTVHPLQQALAGTAGGPSVGNIDFYTRQGTTTIFSDPANCNRMFDVLPSGPNPISGNIHSTMKIDATVQSFNGNPYVQRHSSMVPELADPSASTAAVTLYFTQADFDAYNLARGSNPPLPANSTDAAGKANLRVTQYNGTGTTPDTYTNGSQDIDPDDSKIVWNAAESRWEVTFDVTGFGGLFVTSNSLILLRVTLADLSGKVVEQGNELRWATSLEENTAYFEVQKAGPDGVFKGWAKVAAAGNSHQLLQYSYMDVSGGSGSYRLKMVDIDGHFTYSKIIMLGAAASGLYVRVSPNPAHQPQSVVVGSSIVAGAVLTVTDMSGKRVVEKRIVLQKGDNSLDPGILAGLPQGIYVIGVATDRQKQTIKFVKE